jgi:putative transposase
MNAISLAKGLVSVSPSRTRLIVYASPSNPLGWVARPEGSTFWLSVFNEQKNRGVQDCFIACVDGFKGLAVEAVFPRTLVQLCIVHKLRNSLKYVPWKERKAVAKDLRATYAAPTLAEAYQALKRFSKCWDAKYPAIGPSWLADWQGIRHVHPPPTGKG